MGNIGTIKKCVNNSMVWVGGMGDGLILWDTYDHQMVCTSTVVDP
jgi:hypothetical protein